MKIPRIAWAAYGFAVLVVVLDQLTKAWVLNGLGLRIEGESHAILPPLFNVTLVHNLGVSFGLFGDGSGRWMLSLFSVIVAGLLPIMWSSGTGATVRASKLESGSSAMRSARS